MLAHLANKLDRCYKRRLSIFGKAHSFISIPTHPSHFKNYAISLYPCPYPPHTSISTTNLYIPKSPTIFPIPSISSTPFHITNSQFIAARSIHIIVCSMEVGGGGSKHYLKKSSTGLESSTPPKNIPS